MNIEKPTVDWRRVAVVSAVSAALPWVLGLYSKWQIEAEYREATRVRWTDAARWER